MTKCIAGHLDDRSNRFFLHLQEETSSPAWVNIQLAYPNSLYQAGLREKQCDLWEDIGYATPLN